MFSVAFLSESKTSTGVASLVRAFRISFSESPCVSTAFFITETVTVTSVYSLPVSCRTRGVFPMTKRSFSGRIPFSKYSESSLLRFFISESLSSVTGDTSYLVSSGSTGPQYFLLYSSSSFSKDFSSSCFCSSTSSGFCSEKILLTRAVLVSIFELSEWRSSTGNCTLARLLHSDIFLSFTYLQSPLFAHF